MRNLRNQEAIDWLIDYQDCVYLPENSAILWPYAWKKIDFDEFSQKFLLDKKSNT